MLAIGRLNQHSDKRVTSKMQMSDRLVPVILLVMRRKLLNCARFDMRGQ